MPHALAGLTLLCPLIGYAQTNTGTILGTVEDAKGYTLPNATVTIHNTGTSFRRCCKVTHQALSPVRRFRWARTRFRFPRRVRCSSAENLTLRISDRLQLKFSVKPVDTQAVTVSEQAPLFETATTELGGVVSKEQVANLPINGRAATDLLALIPGVQLRGNAAQISVGGAGIFTNEGGLHVLLGGGDASRVDADDVNNTYGSSAGRVSRASVDAVEEFRVYTDAYSSEFGQTQGGVINLITKSGTNNFHGTLFEYFRNEVLDARDCFNQAQAYKPAYRLINSAARLVVYL